MPEYRVCLKPQDREIEVEKGTSLLNAVFKIGSRLEADCGGMGRCGKCKVIVRKGVNPLTPLEREFLTPFEIRHKVRLACQAFVRTATEISLPSSTPGEDRILEQGIYRSVSFHPALRKIYLPLSSDVFKQQASIENILEKALQQHGIKNAHIDFKYLRTLPSLLNKNETGVTALVLSGKVSGFEQGDTTNRLLGLAVDIGTTTVVGYLYDLIHGRLLGVDSILNQQSAHGSDLVSRIEYALNMPEGLKQLQEEVFDSINQIIDKLCYLNNISDEDIYSLLLVGNTAMNHLFWGVSPYFLSRFPYNLLTANQLSAPSQDSSLRINKAGRIFSLPLISGFIGSDTVGVVLSTTLHKSKIPRLAVDIGTNAEIVLTDGKTMVSCSCAAGPAFEGAQIQCGMRGSSGAIDRVDFIEDKIRYHVIGEVPPKGICGSGLVDAVAGMLKAGLIASDGRLLDSEEIPNAAYARLITRGKYRQFLLNGQDSSAREREVVITQKDIRELQLAKGAMMAGIRILIENLGLKGEDIREIFLAGAFGNYVRAKSAMTIGLIPIFKKTRITQVGNAAGSGAKIALLSIKALKETVKIAEQIQYIELAKAPNFQEEFIKGMGFPKWT